MNVTNVVHTAEDIREEFELEAASNFDVSSHAFDQKKFWDEIKKDTEAKIVKFSGKKKDMVKEKYERSIDIIYKCIEKKVVGMNDITPEKVTTLSAIMTSYKCDLAWHVFNCLWYLYFESYQTWVEDHP